MPELQWLLAYMGLGALVGLLAGLFGIGGGGVMVPVLTMLFVAQGFPAEHIVHMALATSMAAIVPTALASLRAQIEGVRVASDLRSRGIGARLMADAEDRARAAGCGLMQLTTNRTRVDAHRFYDRTGFTPSHIGYKKPL